jgi:hypothetical protein
MSGVSEIVCGFQWPMSDEERSRRGEDAGCDHYCHEPTGHTGPHLCCMGRARHPAEGEVL